MPASRLLTLPRMLMDRAYMPPPFGRRPGGIASRVSFSAVGPRGNGFDVVLLEGTAWSQKSGNAHGNSSVDLDWPSGPRPAGLDRRWDDRPDRGAPVRVADVAGGSALRTPAPASTPGYRHGSIRRRDRSRDAPLRRPRCRRVAQQDPRGRRRAAVRLLRGAGPRRRAVRSHDDAAGGGLGRGVAVSGPDRPAPSAAHLTRRRAAGPPGGRPAHGQRPVRGGALRRLGRLRRGPAGSQRLPAGGPPPPARGPSRRRPPGQRLPGRAPRGERLG